MNAATLRRAAGAYEAAHPRSPQYSRVQTEAEVAAAVDIANACIADNDVPDGFPIGTLNDYTYFVAVDHGKETWFFSLESTESCVLPVAPTALHHLAKKFDSALEAITEMSECARLFDKQQQTRYTRMHAVAVAATVKTHVERLRRHLSNIAESLRPIDIDTIIDARVFCRRRRGRKAAA